MAKLVNFFPLSVYIGDVPQHDALKERFVPTIEALVRDPASPNAWTGDVQGHGFIHRDEAYQPLFDALAPHVRAYLELVLDLREPLPDRLDSSRRVQLSRSTERPARRSHSGTNRPRASAS